MIGKIQKYISLVKFAHTIFAMPFALVGFFMASALYGYGFTWLLFLKVVLAMIFARNAAMGFNRYIDRKYDATNQRTAQREIPAGDISAHSAFMFVVLNSMGFIATTWFINELCFYLSFVALSVVLGYSLTKRFTWSCHFILGLGLSLAPIGAFLAVAGVFMIVPVVLSIAVFLWVAGFDIIYALQDEVFDRERGLFSVPAYFGGTRALWISRIIHIISFFLVLSIGIITNLVWLYYFGVAVFGSMLFYQHAIVKVNDLSRVNVAFFTTNGVASILYAAFTIISYLLME